MQENDEKQLTGYPSIDKPWLKYYTEEAINGKLPECSIYEYMYENNKDYPRDIALNYYGRKITYAELFANIDKTAKAFQAIGVKEGEIVTVALPSIPEALYVVYALNKIGAVANMIHLLAGKNEIIGYLNEVKSRVAVIFDKTMDILGEGIKETSVKQAIVVTAASSLPFGLKLAYSLKSKSPVCKGIYRKWEDFIKGGEHTELKPYKKDCHTMAIISHTGGTTGEPKGVMCSDVSVNALIYQLVCNFEYSRQGVSLVCLPPFVNYSLIDAMLAMLYIGFEVALIPQYIPDKFKEYIKKYKPYVVSSIPAYWEAILKIPQIEKTDMSCLKYSYYGGEAMSSEKENKVSKLLIKCGARGELCKGLGSTEMMAAASQTYADCNEGNSAGVPLVWVNCKIVEPDTTDELSYNQDGEICFSGPTLMMGYYEKPSATDEVVKVHKEGVRWLHTGDIGHIDENGVIYVTGRIKRIIMTKGSDGQVTKIFPDRIEKAVCANQSVELCCVIGVPDDKRINYPKAFVVLKQGVNESDTTKQSIIDTCKSVLPDYMIPDEIEFRSDLPRTPRGKVDYRALEG